MCINNDKSLAPIIMPGDVIAASNQKQTSPDPAHEKLNLNVIFSFCREINGEKKNFCLVTNPRKKLKNRMFTEAES